MTSTRKTLVATVLALALALTVTGCSKSGTAEKKEEGAAKEAAVTAAFPVTVTDDAGRKVTIEKKPERIVSLAPANTEILWSLDKVSSLVGVSTYDDFPAEVTSIPKMGDFLSPNLEAIAGAKPELVLVTTGMQKPTIAKLEGLGVVVLAVDPTTLDGLYASIQMVGEAVGRAEDARQVVFDMRSEIAEIGRLVSEEGRVPTFFEVGYDPLFTTGPGTLTDELIRKAGGLNVVKQTGYVQYSVEQLLKDDPTVYIATTGYVSKVSEIAARPGYGALSAVKDSRVVVIDEDLVTLPGPRVMRGIREIAKALHPKAFEK